MPKEKQSGWRGALKSLGNKAAVALGLKPWIEKNKNRPAFKFFSRFMKYFAPAAALMGCLCLLPTPVAIPLLGGIVLGAGVIGLVNATVGYFKDKNKIDKEVQTDLDKDSVIIDKSARELEKEIKRANEKIRDDLEQSKDLDEEEKSRVSEWIENQDFDSRSVVSDSSFDSDSDWDSVSEYSEDREEDEPLHDSDSILDGEIPLDFHENVGESSDVKVEEKVEGSEKEHDLSDSDSELSVNSGEFHKQLVEGKRKLKPAKDNDPRAAVAARVVKEKFEKHESKAEDVAKPEKAKAEVIGGKDDEKVGRESVRVALSVAKGNADFGKLLQQLLEVVPKSEQTNAEGVKSNFNFENGDVSVKETPGCVRTHVDLKSGNKLDVEEHSNGRYTIKVTGDSGKNVVLHGTGSGLSKDSILEDNTGSKSVVFSGDKFNSPNASLAKEFLISALKEGGDGLRQLTASQIGGILTQSGSKAPAPLKSSSNLVK